MPMAPSPGSARASHTRRSGSSATWSSRRHIGAAASAPPSSTTSPAGWSTPAARASSSTRPMTASASTRDTGSPVAARAPWPACHARRGWTATPPRESAGDARRHRRDLRYDRPRFGGDRRPVLAMLLADPSCRAAIAERDGAVVGHAVLRLDEPRLGPLVADQPRIAESLLSWAFDRRPRSRRDAAQPAAGQRHRCRMAARAGRRRRRRGTDAWRAAPTSLAETTRSTR